MLFGLPFYVIVPVGSAFYGNDGYLGSCKLASRYAWFHFADK